MTDYRIRRNYGWWDEDYNRIEEWIDLDTSAFHDAAVYSQLVRAYQSAYETATGGTKAHDFGLFDTGATPYPEPSDFVAISASQNWIAQEIFCLVQIWIESYLLLSSFDDDGNDSYWGAPGTHDDDPPAYLVPYAQFYEALDPLEVFAFLAGGAAPPPLDLRERWKEFITLMRQALDRFQFLFVPPPAPAYIVSGTQTKSYWPKEAAHEAITVAAINKYRALWEVTWAQLPDVFVDYMGYEFVEMLTDYEWVAVGDGGASDDIGSKNYALSVGTRQKAIGIAGATEFDSRSRVLYNSDETVSAFIDGAVRSVSENTITISAATTGTNTATLTPSIGYLASVPGWLESISVTHKTTTVTFSREEIAAGTAKTIDIVLAAGDYDVGTGLYTTTVSSSVAHTMAGQEPTGMWYRNSIRGDEWWRNLPHTTGPVDEENADRLAFLIEQGYYESETEMLAENGLLGSPNPEDWVGIPSYSGNGSNCSISLSLE